MKKALCLVLCMLLALSCISCGQTDNKEAQTNDQLASSADSDVQEPADDGAADADTDDSVAPAAGDEAAFAPYDETVKVTIGRETVVSLDLPGGDDQENNLYKDALEKALNIEISYDWLVDSSAYNEKVNLTIASGDLPDIMYVNSQAQLKQLVDNELIEDLTDYMKPYFSDAYNKRYENYGSFGLESALFDDRIMAVPNLNGGYEFSFMWVRRDWVEKLGAEMPTTLDEVVDLARLFMEKDPGGNGAGNTIGIATNSHVAGIYNQLGNLDPIFGVFKSFPRQWIRGEDGALSYGTLAPETKEALSYLADIYKEGVLDQEFAVRTGDDFNSLLLSGRCGIFFGPWWMPDWPLNSAIANDPEADWVPVLAPLDSDGKFNVYRQRPNNQWLVVRKGYEHPELVFKMLSMTEALRDTQEVQDFYKGTSVLWTIWPVTMAYRDEDTIPQDYFALKNALDNRDPEGLTLELQNVYEQCITWLETQDPAAWQVYTCRVVGPEVTTRDGIVPVDNVYPLMTDSMELKWAGLEKMENEIILKIIMGESSIDDFDSFVESWNAQGGREITEEVNE